MIAAAGGRELRSSARGITGDTKRVRRKPPLAGPSAGLPRQPRAARALSSYAAQRLFALCGAGGVIEVVARPL